MFKNFKITTKLIIAMMLVSLSALILVYLGMNRTSEELEEKLLSINETIGKNEEAFAEESLLSQAEATIRSVGTLQMRIIYRHLSMINNAVENLALEAQNLYRQDLSDLVSPYFCSPKSEDSGTTDNYTAEYMLCGDAEMSQEVKEELCAITYLNPSFISFLETFPSMDCVYIGTETGLYYNMSKRQSYSEDFNPKNRPWYQEAMENPGEMVWQVPYWDPYGELTITGSMTFQNQDGEIAGVIAFDIFFGKFVQNILPVDPDNNEDTTCFLVSDRYDLVAIENTPDVDFDPSLEAHFEEPEAARKAFMNVGEGAVSAKMDGVDVLMWGSEVPKLGWYFWTAFNLKSISKWLDQLHQDTSLVIEEGERELHSAFNRMIPRLVAGFFLVAAFVLVISSLLSHSLIAPIRRLKEEAAKIGEGSFDQKIEVGSMDEIGELALKFNEMQDSLKSYMENLKKVTAEQERIQADLDVAANLQNSMLPSSFPEDLAVDLWATMAPAKEVAGDFYDYFMIDKTHLAIVVADVSGKGVPASLFMMIGKMLISEHTTPGSDLGEVFTTVNNMLCASNKVRMFITAYEAVLDLESGEVSYVNAGHEHPFLLQKNESGEKSYVEMKIDSGLVLAVMEDFPYKAGRFQMEPGDRLIQYTDGVTEATNADGELYGMGRLSAFLNAHKDLPPKTLLEELRVDIDHFSGDAPQFDDITMLCLEYRKPDTI